MPKRVKVTLSDAQYRLLKLWGAWNGKMPGVYAGQILGNRLEANHKTIMELVEAQAAALKITPEELEAQWLNEPGEEDE